MEIFIFKSVFKICVSILFLCFFYKESFGEINQISREGVRLSGAQVFVMDEGYKNRPDLFFQEAKERGVDTVFFRVFHNKGDRTHFHSPSDCLSGVYFKTSSACVVNDLLGEITEAAHKNGIKIFAWIATRSLSFLKTEDNSSLSFSPGGGTETGYGANIFKPNVRNAIINLFKDLAAYDIDGILFQDDFIIKYNEGADAYSAKLFEAETGLKASPETFFESTKIFGGKKVFSGFKDEFYIWANWKNYHLMEFFREIREATLSVNPKIAFAANVYYETPSSPKQGLAWYSQSLQSLEKAGFDYYAIMGYAEQIATEQRLDEKSVVEFIGKTASSAVKSIKKPEKIIMKLQSRKFGGDKGRFSDKEFEDICIVLGDLGQLSVVAVPIFTSGDIKTCDFEKE